MKCPKCDLNMVNVGIPGEDMYLCFEGCDDIFAVLPVVEDIKADGSIVVTQPNGGLKMKNPIVDKMKPFSVILNRQVQEIAKEKLKRELTYKEISYLGWAMLPMYRQTIDVLDFTLSELFRNKKKKHVHNFKTTKPMIVKRCSCGRIKRFTGSGFTYENELPKSWRKK